MPYKKLTKKNNLLKKIKQVAFSEARARDWRFQCLSRLYLAEHYSILFTGHTGTDFVETALLKLFRGTSLYGIVSFKTTKTYKSTYPKYYNYSIFFTKSKIIF